MSGRIVVSLGAVAANYRRLSRNAQGAVAAVVKADGYGLGAVQVASRLVDEGCREFFVATVEEGCALRGALPEAPIYVFEGVCAASLEAMVGADLIPVLNTPAQCETWTQTRRAAAVHVDTGMQRLGFPYTDGVTALANLPFPVTLFISHFARADEPGHPTIARQIERALGLYKTLREHHPQLRLSLCNSAALLEGLGPEDLGRAGIGLYGGNPYAERENPMQCVVKLEARVMQVRDVPPNTPVGYGGAFVTQRHSRMAVIGVGYADGVPRLLSGSGSVVLHGVECPMAGRISMDLLLVDATDVEVAEGDWAEVIGPRMNLDAVAARAATLGYEVLTGISRRAPRSYVEESL